MIKRALHTVLGIGLFAAAAALSAAPDYDMQTSDPWDPEDDEFRQATPIAFITRTERTHGPHIVGGADPVDWFLVTLNKDFVYNFSAYKPIGGHIMASIYGYRDLKVALVPPTDISDPETTAQITMRAPKTDKYYIKVTPADPETTVSYSLSMHIEALP